MAEQEAVEEIIEEEVAEQVEEVETDESETPNDEEEEVAEKQPWDDDEEDESDGSVPLTAFLKNKRKLKGQIGERDVEIETLKEKLKNLEGAIQPQQTEKPTKRPRSDDFDTDEEYEDALDAWDEQKYNRIVQNLTQQNTQKVEQDNEIQRVGRAV